MKHSFQKVLAFFSIAAFKQRARDRERRRLADELEAISVNRRREAAREKQILERAVELVRLSTDADYEASRKASRHAPSVADFQARLAPAKGPIGRGNQKQETYGRGPRLSTTSERTASFARTVIGLFLVATLAAWALW